MVLRGVIDRIIAQDGRSPSPPVSWRWVSVPLALVLAACSGSFSQRIQEETGCSVDLPRQVFGDCMSKRFAGSDPADVDSVLTRTGLVRVKPGTYVYSGGYSYGLTVFVHAQSGRVARISAI